MRLFAALLSLAVAGPLAAQQYASPMPPQPPPAVTAEIPTAPPNLGAQFAGLADQPASHFGTTFDRNMLQLAQGYLEAGGMEHDRAAAALHGIAIDNYRYQRPAFYTPEAMAALLASYNAAGWKHLVNANQTPENSAQPSKPITDMWLHFTGADVDGVTVLTRGVKTMNVIQVACDLRPLDLLHLGRTLRDPEGGSERGDGAGTALRP